ncbi:MAG: hypothetical protein WCZ90_05655 [Melioribacteraceae bacterium]
MIKNIFLALILVTVITNSQSKRTKSFFSETDGYVKVTWDTYLFLANKMEVPLKKNTPQNNFDYMFIKTPVDTLFKLPFIVVQINERGRLRKADLTDFVENRYRLDVQTNYLWKEGSDQLHVIIPTKYGSINIFCRSSVENFAKDKDSFKKFVNSIVLYNDTKYSTNFLRDIPILNRILFESSPLGTVLFFVAVAFIASRWYKRMRS